MCLIAVAVDAHPDYALVLAANRDEFHDRPAAPASWWDDHPQVFGGRDLRRHGSWLAVSRSGRWAAVTNVRRMVPPDPAAPSRGALVGDFVAGGLGADEWCAAQADAAAGYAGFNLLLGDGRDCRYAGNQPGFHSQRLAAGIHGVSNAALDTPWPKLLRLRSALEAWCGEARGDPAPLFGALADSRPAADAQLPDTGVGLEMERFLSPPFIRGAHYGTRASTLLLIDRTHNAWLQERRFGPLGVVVGETVERFALTR